MNDILKWTGKQAVVAAIWVFIFSITIEGRTLFSYANGFLVQNPMVATVDQELGVLWNRVYETARTTFQSLSGSDQRS